MNEIIQSLECNATNGKENFCYISKKRLEAIKKLSTIEDNEFKKLNKGIDELIKKYEYEENYFLSDKNYLNLDKEQYSRFRCLGEFIQDLKKLKGE